MKTLLRIEPRFQDKSAKIKGTIAAGENIHVEVYSVKELNETLRLRILGVDGATLAQFPIEKTDVWNQSITPSPDRFDNDYKYECDLNLNTVQMIEAVPKGVTMPLLLVLDDVENEVLYCKELTPITHWPRREGDDDPIDLSECVDFKKEIKEAIEDLDERVEEIEANGSGPAVEVVAPITHAELVELRNNSGLTPGMQYRITDYVATTKQSNTKSANHPFDIIVTADDEKTLNEVARAIRHEGDTYFANCKLEAWKIWYCLDNDESRFWWTTSSEKIDGVAVAGKGVIYRMIDEWDNDVPYDFKGILMKAYLVNSWSSDYLYTFGGSVDETVESESTCFSNKMGVSITSGRQEINQNTFGEYCYCNTFGSNCYCNTFGEFCHGNKFGEYCYCNTFGDECHGNKFGEFCYYNTFGNSSEDNIFGISCYGNKFGDECLINNFGNDCYTNTFGEYCVNNRFREHCYSNTIGNYCTNNEFGSNCYYNDFGDECYGNKFREFCSYNTFGNGSGDNIFGEDCSYITFGMGCNYNTFGASKDNPKDNYRYITFGNGCKGINLYCTASTSWLQPYKNVEIKSGVTGDVNEYGELMFSKTITDDNVNQSFHTTYKPVGSMEISI